MKQIPLADVLAPFVGNTRNQSVLLPVNWAAQADILASPRTAARLTFVDAAGADAKTSVMPIRIRRVSVVIAQEDGNAILKVTNKGDGTGQGLAIVRSIMSTHDGVVTASSLPGGETTFTLVFPTAGMVRQTATKH